MEASRAEAERWSAICFSGAEARFDLKPLGTAEATPLGTNSKMGKTCSSAGRAPEQIPGLAQDTFSDDDENGQDAAAWRD